MHRPGMFYYDESPDKVRSWLFKGCSICRESFSVGGIFWIHYPGMLYDDARPDKVRIWYIKRMLHKSRKPFNYSTIAVGRSSLLPINRADDYV